MKEIAPWSPSLLRIDIRYVFIKSKLKIFSDMYTVNHIFKKITSSQNTNVPNGRPGVAGRVSPLKRQPQQNTIPQEHPKPSDWKHIQKNNEEKIQNLYKEINNLKSKTADQRNQLEEKEKRIEELTTR